MEDKVYCIFCVQFDEELYRQYLSQDLTMKELREHIENSQLTEEIKSNSKIGLKTKLLNHFFPKEN